MWLNKEVIECKQNQLVGNRFWSLTVNEKNKSEKLRNIIRQQESTTIELGSTVNLTEENCH